MKSAWIDRDRKSDEGELLPFLDPVQIEPSYALPHTS